MTDSAEPIPMILHCPECGERHVDEGKFATKSHHTHACQHCGFVWRPAVVPTTGVQFLPGFGPFKPIKLKLSWNGDAHYFEAELGTHLCLVCGLGRDENVHRRR